VITEHQSLWDICVHCMWASLNSTEYTAFPVTTLLQHSAFACGREPVSQTSLYNVKHILMWTLQSGKHSQYSATVAPTLPLQNLYQHITHE